MRLVHLSDIHLSLSNLYDLEHYYLKSLLHDLDQFNKGIAIDLILITGDLVDKGGESFQNQAYDIFEKKFIEPIIDTLKLTKDRNFIQALR